MEELLEVILWVFGRFEELAPQIRAMILTS